MTTRGPLLSAAGAVLVLAAFAQPGTRAQGPESRAESRAPSIEARYGGVAQRIITSALLRNDSWALLHELCDGIGPRLSGSPALERAVVWAQGAMKKARLENVRAEEVMVPVWIRGDESVELVEPRAAKLPALALGGSVGTGAQPVEAPIVVVKSFDELDALGADAVRGHIVVFNVPYEGYGRTVQYRALGASRAGRLGAVGALVRSAGPSGLRTPHTGMMRYEDGVPRVPAAAISAEDAAMLGRLQAAGGRVVVRMKLGCETRADAASANVVGEIVGSTFPDEVVLIGGHLDSWDVGQGAHDDGGGAVSCLEAVAHLVRLGLRPRRTIRVVLWTNEENGLRGAYAYRDRYRDALSRHVLAIENDGGVERPIGFGLAPPAKDASPEVVRRAETAAETFRAVVGLLAPVGADTMAMNGGGADIGPLMREGVLGGSITTVMEKYFEWHHTEADTIDKVDRANLDLHVAALAVVAYVVADLPERL